MGIIIPRIVKGMYFKGVITNDTSTEIKCFVDMEGYDRPIECRSLLKYQWRSEEWRDEFYELFCTENGFIYYRHNNRYISHHINKTGYINGRIYYNRKYRYINIHRAIAYSFIKNPDPKNKIQVNHIDGNKQNNDYRNLEWVTQKENLAHAFLLGLKTKQLTDDQVIQIREEYNSGKLTQTQLAKIYNTHVSTITEIVQNNYYIDDNYTRTRFSISQPKNFDNQTINKIRELGNSGITRRKLASMYDVDSTTISSILLNKSYIDQNYIPLRSTLSNRLLPTSDIRLIRIMYKQGFTLKVIADKYQLSMAAISKIIRKETYAHID